MKYIKKIVAASLIMLTLVGVIPVFAAGGLPIKIGLAVIDRSVSVGSKFRVNVMLDFDNSFDKADGITVMRYGLKFDTSLLELLDPYTMEPVGIGDDGEPIDGGYYKFGNIGMPESFSVTMNEDKDTLILLYGGRNAEGDIYSPGDFAQFAFQAKSDIAITDSLSTAVEIVNPEVSVNNKDAVLDISGEKLYLSLIPPFSLPSVGSYKQNTTLKIEGKAAITSNSAKPLNAIISKGESIIAEKSAAITAARYSAEFELNEELYVPGTYKVALTDGSSSVSTLFEVLTKDAPPVISPEPEQPGSAGEPPNPSESDDKKEEDVKNPDNNRPPDSNSNSSGTSSGSGTGTAGWQAGSKGESPNSSNVVSEKDSEIGKAEVNYPNDIERHWAAANIRYIYDYKLMNGYEDGSFAPDSSITRAEFAAVMARFLELEGNTDAASSFTDVSGHWAKAYISALAERKIVGGVSDTEFEPDAEITREQIAVILSRAFSLENTKQNGAFADDEIISDWAYDGVYSVLAAGYMKGDENGNFSPLSNATRAEVATVIYRLHMERNANQ